MQCQSLGRAEGQCETRRDPQNNLDLHYSNQYFEVALFHIAPDKLTLSMLA